MDEFLNNRTNPIQKYSPLAKGFSDFINVCSRPSNDHPENKKQNYYVLNNF